MQPIKSFPKSSRLGRKYAMVTAYDAPTAEILESCKVDFILVGDSLGMVILGYPNTAMVTMDEMVHHVKAVRRGAPKSYVIADLPKKGVEKGVVQALASAQRFVGDCGANAVKIEWGRHCLKSTEAMVKKNIVVQGHVGLTPQDAKDKNDFKVRGKLADEAETIYFQAKSLESAGASLLLLECVPWQLAKQISEAVKIPTIGIGAGAYCDGQVLVFHDLVGLYDKMDARFVKRYAHTSNLMRQAVDKYCKEVRSGKFPDTTHSFTMDQREYDKLKRDIG